MEQGVNRNGEPWGQTALRQKHEDQMRFHETNFGKLGELQTDEQKKALAEYIEKNGTKIPKRQPKKQTPPPVKNRDKN